MKKVLILSYFFPPSNFAGSYRMASWAKYLHRYGYYPVVITRCWNNNQTDITDAVKDNRLKEEESETCHIIRTPYRNTLRDRLHHSSGSAWATLARKVLSFAELILQNFFPRMIPYYRMYREALNYIDQHGDIDVVLISGRPFHAFWFGHLIRKKTGVPWVADYRDEWSTSKLIQHPALIERLILRIEKSREMKWLSNAAAFTTCSGNWRDSIGSFLHLQGYVVLNGYDPDDFEGVQALPKPDEEFRMVYNGTLYPTQRIEVFLDAVAGVVKENNSGKRIVLYFPGLQVYPAQEQRVKQYLQHTGVEAHFSGRKPKQDVIALQKSADLLLMIAHDGVKGNHSSKIFEYFACGVPILLCPSDHDVIEAFVRTTNSGYIADTKEECMQIIQLSMRGAMPYEPNMEEGKQYTRELQTGVLARILDQVAKG